MRTSNRNRCVGNGSVNNISDVVRDYGFREARAANVTRPVRMRIASSIGVTKILPSPILPILPILPVFAAVAIAWIVLAHPLRDVREQ